jgi:hypothetical protein
MYSCPIIISIFYKDTTFSLDKQIFIYIIILQMTQDSKKMIENYLTNYFSIKRKKIKSKNWGRVVTIPGGFIRTGTKVYQWSQTIELHLIVIDLTKIVENVFGCNNNEAQDLVLNHLKLLSTSRATTSTTRRRGIPVRRPLG